jgi:hypothetical protein
MIDVSCTSVPCVLNTAERSGKPGPAREDLEVAHKVYNLRCAHSDFQGLGGPITELSRSQEWVMTEKGAGDRQSMYSSTIPITAV